MSSKRLRSSDRQNQLLKMALKAYAKLGVERAGHGDVAKLAGVSTATVFKYFPTRTALTNAVLNHIKCRINDLFKELPSDLLSPADHITLLANTYVQLVSENEDLIKVYLNWTVSYGPEVRPLYLAFQENILNFIHHRLTVDDGDRSDARLILAAAHSYAAMKLDHTSDEILKRFIERVRKAFL